MCLAATALVSCKILIGLDIFSGSTKIIENIYQASVGVCFFVVGIVEAHRDPKRVFRQFLFVSAISFPVMFLQIINFPDWISYLNTQKFVEGIDISNYSAPFLAHIDGSELYGMKITTQARPAGISWSNAFTAFLLNASMFILLFMVSNKTRLRYRWPVYFAIVWCMAKVTLIGSIILTAYFYIARTKRRFKDLLVCVSLIAVPLLLYSLMFPGFFEKNLSTDAITFSVMIRVLDFLIYSKLVDAEDTIADLREIYSLSGYETDADIGGLSGLADLVYLIPIVFLVLLFVVFGRSSLALRIRSGLKKDYMVGFFLVMMLSLIATPLIGNSLMWLLTGVVFTMSMKKIYPPDPNLNQNVARAM